VRKNRILFLIVLMVLIPFVGAKNYQESAGSWTVEFNSSQSFSIQKQQLNAESGSAWMVALDDSAGHEVAGVFLYDFQNLISTDNTTILDSLIDNLLAAWQVPSSTKSSIWIDGTDGRQGEGYSSTYKRTARAAVYPYKSHYDSFYSQNATKNLVVYGSLQDVTEYNEIINSLHVMMHVANATNIKVSPSPTEQIASSLTASSQTAGQTRGKYLDHSDTEKQSQESRPETGTFMKDTQRDGLGRITIINDNNKMDALAVLTDLTKKPLISVYIRGGESFNISNIKDGSYDLYFKLGNQWNQDNSKFSENEARYKLGEPLQFTTKETWDGTQYSTWTISLAEAVPDANRTIDKVPVSVEEFPS